MCLACGSGGGGAGNADSEKVGCEGVHVEGVTKSGSVEGEWMCCGCHSRHSKWGSARGERSRSGPGREVQNDLCVNACALHVVSADVLSCADKISDNNIRNTKGAKWYNLGETQRTQSGTPLEKPKRQKVEQYWRNTNDTECVHKGHTKDTLLVLGAFENQSFQKSFQKLQF